MKKGLSLLELIVAVSILGVILSLITLRPNNTNLLEASNKLKLYLNYTRYIAFIDNKENIKDLEYYKKYWTLKFQNCSDESDGLYFVVYSDMAGGTAHFKKKDTLKDPLTNKYLYSNYDCEVSDDESKYILLTKEYGIKSIDLSCNTTSTIGQLSFSNDGKVYSNLGTNPSLIDEKCYLKIYDENNGSETITIEPNTGLIH